jgi:hypothetical protein
MKTYKISGLEFTVKSQKVFYKGIHIGHECEDIRVLIGLARFIDFSMNS